MKTTRIVLSLMVLSMLCGVRMCLHTGSTKIGNVVGYDAEKPTDADQTGKHILTPGEQTMIPPCPWTTRRTRSRTSTDCTD